MSWTADKFKTAQDWIRASAKDKPVEDRYVDALASIAKKRVGVWTILRTAPRDISRAVVWHAFKNARHAVQWGDLSAWHGDTTVLLMRATDEQRELFDYVFDTTLAIAKK